MLSVGFVAAERFTLIFQPRDVVTVGAHAQQLIGNSQGSTSDLLRDANRGQALADASRESPCSRCRRFAHNRRFAHERSAVLLLAFES